MSIVVSRTLSVWNTGHACAIMLGLLLFFIQKSNIWLLFLFVLSITTLLFLYRGRWTPLGHLGLANAITLLRALLILFLGFQIQAIHGLHVVAIGLMILALDGLDGWVSRRWHHTSDMGEFLDKETDAFFFLVLAIAVVQLHRLGIWILFPASLRYLFILLIGLLPTPVQKERRWRWGRWISIYMSLALLTVFLPIHPINIGFTIVGALLITYSFGRDFLWIYQLSRTSNRS